MDRRTLKFAARTQIKGKIGILFLCYLAMFGICFVAGLIPVAGAILAALVVAPLSVGICKVYLELTKGNDAEVKNVLAGFSCLGKSIFLYILIGVFTFLWSLLFMIPGIIKSYSYSMAYYVMADNPEMTAREALRESKRIMQGHKWELFVLHLSFFLWSLLVVFTFGVAAIYVAPYMSATVANFYQTIKKEAEEIDVSETVRTEENAETI